MKPLKMYFSSSSHHLSSFSTP